MLRNITKLLTLAALVTVLCAGTVRAQTNAVSIDAPITDIKLFKNGLSLVTRSFSVKPAGGTFIINDPPKPIHGTFWVESEQDVKIRFIKQQVTKKAPSLTPEILIEHFVGKEIEVFLSNKDQISGTVLNLSEKSANKSDETDKNRSSTPYYYSSSSLYSNNLINRNAQDTYLALKTDNGIEFIDYQKIWRYKTKDDDFNLISKTNEPVIEVTLSPAKSQQVARISYLTRGMAWVPSYRLDLDGKNKGTLNLKAVIKNELTDINQVKLSLISGFPAIRFEFVTSPLSLQTTLKTFFSELSQKKDRYSGGSGVMTQQVMSNVAAPSSGTMATMPQFLSDGYDMHFQDIGQHSLNAGESALIQIEKANIKYQRIVEWNIPDARDERGRNRRPSDIFNQDEVWDAVQLSNPFSFPMTTAPITTFKNNKIHGQTLSYWTASGEEFVVRISKALNIRVNYTERELEGKRERILIMGDDYRKTIVEGELHIRNFRKQSEQLVIIRSFSGKLIDSEGNPTKELLREGIYSVNEKSLLKWRLDLEPWQEITLKYRYEVLIDI